MTGGTQLVSCLAKEFAKQNFLLNNFMKLGPGMIVPCLQLHEQCAYLKFIHICLCEQITF